MIAPVVRPEEDRAGLRQLRHNLNPKSPVLPTLVGRHDSYPQRIVEDVDGFLWATALPLKKRLAELVPWTGSCHAGVEDGSVDAMGENGQLLFKSK